jgi:hypothetical protein
MFDNAFLLFKKEEWRTLNSARIQNAIDILESNVNKQQ